MLSENELNEKLLEASEKGVFESVVELVDSGANLNAIDQDGDTPLLLTIAEGNIGIAKYLIEHGADPVQLNTNKDSFLHVAIYSENIECVEFALSIFPYIDVSNCEGLTPLNYAIENNDQEVFEYLVSKGAYINGVDIDGWTLLHHASDLGFEWFVNRLEELGADKEVVSLKGNTAQQLAQFREAKSLDGSS